MTPQQKRWISLLIFGVLSILAGLIIVLWTGLSVAVYMTFAGIMAIIGGVLELAEMGNLKSPQTLKPVLLIVLGIAFVLMPIFMAEVTAIVFGLFSILFGAVILLGLGNATDYQLLSNRVVGAVMVVIGILIIVFPVQAVEIMAIIIGVILMMIGLVTIVNAVQTRKSMV